MLDILQQKILSWTPSRADEFHINLPRFHPDSSRIWETAPTGYFLYDPTYCGYFDYNGQSYILVAGDHTADYTRKQLLSNAADTNNSIAIEKPTVIEAVTLWGIVYTYVEQVRPFNTMGINVLNLIQTSNPADIVDIYVAESIKAEQSLIGLIDTVIATPTEPVYPESLDTLKRLYYDPGTQRYFLIGDIKGEITRDEYVEKAQRLINSPSAISQLLSKLFGTQIDLTSKYQDLMKLCLTFQPA